MSDHTTVVTASHGISAGVLPLRERTEIVVRTYFRCTNCRVEQRFSWHSVYCTENGALLCFSCAPVRAHDRDGIGWRLCRRCRQPRRTGLGPDTDFTWYGAYLPPAYTQYPDGNTICNACRRLGSKRAEPLQVVCLRCETTFIAKRSDAKFCSAKCRTAAHRAAQSKGVAR